MGEPMFQPFLKTDVRITDKEQGLSVLRKFGACASETVVIASTGTIRRFQLKEAFSEQVRFLSDFSPNPTVEDLRNCLVHLEENPAKYFICIGGGSAIDMGKAVCAVLDMGTCVHGNYEELCSVISEKKYLGFERRTRIAAVPTTAGTGADVTQWATVWDMQNHKKLSVDKPGLAPELSVIIPEFTSDLPVRLTLSTGLDALAQAMESFWSRARNPLSQAISLEAVRYIREYLPLVLKEPENAAWREGMCVGALLSGIAFSKTRTTACHSISYPITMEFGVEHGFAAALTLAAVAKRNLSGVPEISKLYEVFGGELAFCRWLDEVSNPIQPLRLSAFGIEKSDISGLAAGTFTQGRMDNNPVLFTQKEVEDILLEIL